jgi:pyruvate/2-oxoacid:ferredoxin oxidoreductase beta subunit
MHATCKLAHTLLLFFASLTFCTHLQLRRWTPSTELPATTDAEGYVHLAEHGKLTLDSKRIKGNLEDFLQRENRFSSLTRKNPKASEELHHHLQVRAVMRL